jgi:hypothetical protein
VTYRDALDRLAQRGHAVSVTRGRLAVRGALPPRVQAIVRRHRAALLAAHRGHDAEITDLKLDARTRDAIGATHKIGDQYTTGDGDGPIVDLFLGFTDLDELEAAQRDRLHRWRGFLRGMRRRAN